MDLRAGVAEWKCAGPLFGQTRDPVALWASGVQIPPPAPMILYSIIIINLCVIL